MNVNIKNVITVLNEKYGDLPRTVLSQKEEEEIANNIIDILEAYRLDRVDVSESLEYDDCLY